MRISAEEIAALEEALSRFVPDKRFSLYLFGSRLDDQMKGGDVDLLCIVSSDIFAALISRHSEILVAMKQQAAIGQRRIDLKICQPQDLKSDPFLETIAQKMKLIAGQELRYLLN